MNDADLLSALLKSLASESNVYARWCRSAGVDLAQQVHTLAKVAEADWAKEAVRGATGPESAEEVAAALSPVDHATAIELMANLSADDLVFPGHTHRDRARAQRAAQRVTAILGPGAEWFSNIEGPWKNGRGWTPVTRHTVDGVIAGRGAGLVAVLLQVGED